MEMADAALGIMFKAVRNQDWGHPSHNRHNSPSSHNCPFIVSLGQFILDIEVRTILLRRLMSFFYSNPSDYSSLSQSEAWVLTMNSKVSDVLVDQLSRRKQNKKQNTLICKVRWLSWCKYSHNDWFSVKSL